MRQEKKFFSPQLRTYSNDLAKRWRIEWYVPTATGKARRCPNPIYGNISSGKTIEERQKLADNIISGLRLDLPRVKEKTILDKVFEIKGIAWKPKTLSSYKTVKDSYAAWLKKRDPKTIREVDFYAYLNWLKARGYQQNNIAKFRDVLYTLYEYAKKFKLTTVNPVQKESRIKKAPRSLMFFTDQQIRQIKTADMPAQLGLAIGLLFYCFIRPGEQRHMRIDWINFEYQYIEVPGQWSKNGKTEKVAIPNAFLPMLQHLKEYPAQFYVLSKSGAPGLVQISTKYLNNEHSKVLEALKIRGRYAFYSWKHTGAVKAVKAGVNIKDLQLQLRHHSLDMVNEYLKNLGVLDSEDLRDKFPAL